MKYDHAAIVEDVCKFYDEQIRLVDEYDSAGYLMKFMGDLYQNLAIRAIKRLDPELSCRHNDYITKWSPSGRYRNDKLQVDLHVYRKNKLLFLLESKTYFDTSHIKRTIVDFQEIRSVVGDIPAIVWSGQNGMSYNSEGYYREMCDFDFFVINQTAQRNRKYAPFKTKDPLNKNVLMKFIKRVDEIIKGQ